MVVVVVFFFPEKKKQEEEEKECGRQATVDACPSDPRRDIVQESLVNDGTLRCVIV